MTVAEIIQGTAARAWRLERELTVSQWADGNRVLSSVSSAEHGKWRTSRTPYLREIMDLLSVNNPTEELCLMKGAQVGGTEALLNWIGYTIETVPGPMLIVQPTLDLLKKFSKQRLRTAIAASPELLELVGSPRERDSSNTLVSIDFPGGTLMLTTARSASGLSSLPIRFLGCDEIDRYPGDVDGEGDPIELAKMRTATFAGSSKKAYVSTPKLRGLSKIERIYNDLSDQRRYFIPCPRCQHMDFLTWQGFRDFLAQEDPGHHRIGWEEGSPELAFMVCGACGERISEGEKPWMFERGEWRALAPGPGKMPGFHLSALYSPLGWYSWGLAAKTFVEVKGKPEEFQTWVNTTLGETWEVKGESVSWQKLMARVEDYPESEEGEQRVPTGVGAIAAAVDVQGDRLEWAVWGFGEGEESWLLATGAEPGDPAQDKVWAEVDKVLLETFIHERGKRLPIDIATVDSGGHHTEKVYEFCLARLIAGRKVYPIKGSSEVGVPFVGTPSRTNPYKVPLHLICTDVAKGALYSRLQILDVGPGFVHFPRWLGGDEEFFQQLTAEKAIRYWASGRGSVRKWIKIRERNEQLDLAVYALAGLYILGGRRAPLWLKDRALEYAERVVEPPPPPAPEPGQIQVPQRLLRPPTRNWVTGGY